MGNVELLRALLLEGGISVVTPLPGAPGSPAAMTLIQLDGDIVTRVTRDFIDDCKLQRQHHASIAAALKPFDDFGRSLRRWNAGVIWVHRGSLAAGYLPTIYGAYHLWLGQIELKAIVSALSLLLAVANTALGDRFRGWLLHKVAERIMKKLDSQ